MKRERKLRKGVLLAWTAALGLAGMTVTAEAKTDTYVGDYLKLKTTLESTYTGTDVYNLNTSTTRYCYTSAYTYNKNGTQIDYDNCYGPKSTGCVSSFYYSSAGACAKVKGYGSIRKTDSSTSTLLEKHTTILE